MTTAIQDDEIAALRAIYDADYQQAEGAETSYSIMVRGESGTLSLELSISLPSDYPEVSPPIYQLKDALWLTGQEKEHITRNLQRIFSEGRGEVVVYQWVEWMRDYFKTIEQNHQGEAVGNSPASPNEGGVSRTINDSEWCSSHTSADMVIVHGEPVTFKKSTFQAHVTSIKSHDEVKAMLAQLKTNKKIATATHNIVAYRISCGNSIFHEDFDNDGESGAGNVLLHLLQVVDAQNIAIVVTRWFGGVLLHHDRFKCIKNVASDLITETGIGLEQHQDSQQSQQKNTSSKKKRK